MRLIDYKSLKLSSILGWCITVFNIYIIVVTEIETSNNITVNPVPTLDEIFLIYYYYTLVIGCLSLLVPIEFFKTKNVGNKKYNILSNVLFYMGIVFNILFLLILYYGYIGISHNALLSSPIIVLVLYIFILCFYRNRTQIGQ